MAACTPISTCFRVAPKCEGDLVYYGRDGNWPVGCQPCPAYCDKRLLPCPMICARGCGCPPEMMTSPTESTRCIKKEDCPPTGIIIT